MCVHVGRGFFSRQMWSDSSDERPLIWAAEPRSSLSFFLLCLLPPIHPSQTVRAVAMGRQAAGDGPVNLSLSLLRRGGGEGSSPCATRPPTASSSSGSSERLFFSPLTRLLESSDLSGILLDTPENTPPPTPNTAVTWKSVPPSIRSSREL